jgi:carboxymethylenebutenolidase
MQELDIEVPTPNGSSDGILFRPDGNQNFPGVLYLTDIVGIRPASREAAGRLAERGYVVLMPNLFYRTGRAPLHPSVRELSGDAAKKRMAELAGPLPQDAMERDASAYVDFLTLQKGVSNGTIGVVGYCFSGKMAMYAAAVRPGKIAAAASFHGGGLYTDGPTSPHHVLPLIKARLYFAHAVQDRSMPEEAIVNLEHALKRWGGKYESETYEGAHHSWTSTDSPVYNQAQAERAYQKLLELFQESLR